MKQFDLRNRGATVIGYTSKSVLISILIGYAMGCISPSFMIGKLHGIDVRVEGSGNAGASNTVIMVGKMAGLTVALLDILKSALAWWVCAMLFPGLAIAGPIAGSAAILGHMFPVTLHFHGGKGLACIGGVVLAYNPRTLLILLGVALLIGIVTRYVAIVTVSLSVIWPLYYGLATSLWLGAAILAVPALPIFCKHMENFRRMKTGEELRLSYLWNKEGELARIDRQEEAGR